MKRTLAFLLAVLLCGSLAACGRDPSVSSTESAASSPGTTAMDESTISTESTDPAQVVSTVTTASNAVSPKNTTTTRTAKTTKTQKPSSNQKDPNEIDTNKGEAINNVTLPPLKVQGKTVELLTWDSPESEASKKMIADYKKAYGATLKMTNADWGSMQSVLNSRVMAENPPDVVQVRSADYYTYQLSGILQDISGKIDYSTPLWKGAKGMSDSLKIFDKQYIAPYNSYVGLYIWYNKSIMLDNGIMDTPDKLYEQGKWTVSAMRSLAKELTVRDGENITQYGLGSNYGSLANCLEVARGAKEVKFEKKKFTSNMNDPALADVYNMMYDLYAVDKCMAPIDQHTNLFAKSRCAMLVEGSWLTQQRSFKALKQKGTIAMVPFPKWDGQPEYQLAEMQCLGIPRGAKNTDLGMSVIHFSRQLAIDANKLKESEEFSKETYFMTDKELKYQTEAASKGVIGSWVGIPNSPSYLMAMTVAYGNAWSVALEKYGPEMQKAVDELNAMFK